MLRSDKGFFRKNNLCPTEVKPQEVVSAIADVRENFIKFVEVAQDLQVTDNLKIDPKVLEMMRALGYVGGAPEGKDLKNNPYIQKHPHVLEHLKTGNFFMSLDSLTSAVNEFRKALTMSQQDIDIRRALSFALYRNGNFEEVVKTLQPIIFKIEDAEIFVLMGLALKEMGRTDNSIEYFRKASDLQPDGLAAAINAAELLMKRRRFDEADVYVQRIMTHHYGKQPALLNIISFYINNDNLEGARNLLLNQLKIAQSGTLYAILAIVYHAMGANSEANKCLKQASKLGVSQRKFTQIRNRLNNNAKERH